MFKVSRLTKMEKKNNLISGRIVEFFMCGSDVLPDWEEILLRMRSDEINTFNGFENMPDSFLGFVLRGNEKLLKKISEFNEKHYYLLNNLFKDYYKLDVCNECGNFTRKCDSEDEPYINYVDVVDSNDWESSQFVKRKKIGYFK